MKKLLNVSIIYAIAAMAGSVFYREFTKWNHFSGVTALGKVHAHLFMLGMFVFLVAALFSERFHLADEKSFQIFLKVYNIGLPLTALMLTVRGIIQVRGIQLSAGENAAVSGIAGIGHILTGTGLILFLLSVKRVIKNEK